MFKELKAATMGVALFSQGCAAGYYYQDIYGSRQTGAVSVNPFERPPEPICPPTTPQITEHHGRGPIIVHDFKAAQSCMLMADQSWNCKPHAGLPEYQRVEMRSRACPRFTP